MLYINKHLSNEYDIRVREQDRSTFKDRLVTSFRMNKNARFYE